MQELRWAQDGSTLNVPKHPQVLIARNQIIDLRRYRHTQKGIVVGIAADGAKFEGSHEIRGK